MQEQSPQIVSVSERLVAIRYATGDTWDELAARIGLSRSMLTKVRSGNKHLGVKAMKRLSDLEIENGIISHHGGTQKVLSKNPCDGCVAAHKEIENLKTQLAQAAETISNLSKALASARGPTPVPMPADCAGSEPRRKATA